MKSVRTDSEITFVDDDGVRWTVKPLPAGRVLGAGPVGLRFTSEAGERRLATALPAEGVRWQAIEVPAWRALLREALLLT